jgi:hypothetical protein
MAMDSFNRLVWKNSKNLDWLFFMCFMSPVLIMGRIEKKD